MFSNGNDLVMPVAPAYGGYGGGNGSFFGGDGIWAVIILALLFNGGFGGFGGYGGMMGMGMADGMFLYPWMNQADITTSGFQNQMLQSSIQGLQSSVTSGFGDVQTALCGGFAGVNASINNAQNAVSQQLFTNQIADMERSFASQTAVSGGIQGLSSQLAQCCCDNRLATCQTQNIIQNEGNQTRFADANNTRDIIDATNRGNQMILDKLCQLELDGVKQNYENRIAGMQNVIDGLSAQVNAADRRVAMGEEVDALYNRLSNCPVPSVPVYGKTNIFNCNQNAGCGCGNF
jgi:hypothetical protein